MKTYLFILGRHPELSRAELRGRADEVFYDVDKNLLLANNLQFNNPRALPRGEEQLFIDQLGGTIRMAEVVGEFFDRTKLKQAIWDRVAKAEKFKCGFTVFGGGKKLLPELIFETKDHFEANPPGPARPPSSSPQQGERNRKIRIENYKQENLSSGQIFQRRILQKGHEFIVWQRDNSYLLCETVANQNLRNYELRDRKKDFRDAKMGMLPPKLAQILINLVQPEPGQTILDPFCGSGTVNIEAAILGHPTVGSDLNERFVGKAQENFLQMAEKFRYLAESGEFNVVDAKYCVVSSSTAIATEGWLGENFEARPDRDTIHKNAGEVLDLWRQIFKHLAEHEVNNMAFCLPAWNRAGSKQSISDKLFQFIKPLGYEIVPFPSGKLSAFYERENAFVAREVCVVRRLK